MDALTSLMQTLDLNSKIISEGDYLDIDSLELNWEVHPSGFGMLTDSIVTGSSNLELLGPVLLTPIKLE